jgi:hypothetical protein
MQYQFFMNKNIDIEYKKKAMKRELNEFTTYKL